MQCMCRCRYHWCPPYLLHPGDIPACWYSQRNPMTRRCRRRSPLNSHTGTLSECSSLHPTYTWNSRSGRAEMKTNTHYPNNYLIIVGNREEGGHNNLMAIKTVKRWRKLFCRFNPPNPPYFLFAFEFNINYYKKFRFHNQKSVPCFSCNYGFVISKRNYVVQRRRFRNKLTQNDWIEEVMKSTLFSKNGFKYKLGLTCW